MGLGGEETVLPGWGTEGVGETVGLGEVQTEGLGEEEIVLPVSPSTTPAGPRNSHWRASREMEGWWWSSRAGGRPGGFPAEMETISRIIFLVVDEKRILEGKKSFNLALISVNTSFLP